jgi:hypothetical protein
MKPLEKFKATSPPKRRVSRLKKYTDEILELYNNGYQVEQIQEFLRAQGIIVSVDAINKFKRNLSKTFPYKPSSGSAAQNSKKSVEELKNSPKTNIATKLFLQNLD